MASEKKKEKKDPRDWTTKDSLKWWGNKLFGTGAAAKAGKALRDRNKQTQETLERAVKGKKKKGG